MAEEVVQTVFLRLAKAAPKLKTDAELVAWLHRTTVHVAIDAWRSETRRHTREQHAAAMEPDSADTIEVWHEIAPGLDEALNKLSDIDRQAVLLRFFQQKTMREVGGILGVSEDAAKMRVSRAVDRLRSQLTVSGTACSVVALASLMTRYAVEAAPGRLVAALNSTQFLTSSGVNASAAALHIFSLIILMSKTKLTIVLATLAVIGLGVIGTYRTKESGIAGETIVTARNSQATRNPAVPARSRRAFDRAQVNDLGTVAVSNLDPAALEDAKRELRELLQKPPPGKGYPPPELRRVLGKFGASSNIAEAMPILLEACNVSDYETRAWALSGLSFALQLHREFPGSEDGTRENMFALARPAFSKILRSPDEPQMLRVLALSGYFASTIGMDGLASSAPPFDAESTEDLLAALRVSKKGSDGFGFTVGDHLTRYLAKHADEAEKFIAGIAPLLKDPQPQQRLMAAYALASWPGEKPPEVKNELLAALKSRKSDHSYRAASGLGKLGADAMDTVPELFAFAERTKNWTAGYAESAWEAACRLNPALRVEYPAIDAKLKQEEEAFSKLPTEVRTLDVRQWAATLTDAQEGPALQESFIASIQSSSEPDKTKEAILAQLEQTLLQAPANQRAAIQSVLEAVRQAVTSDKSGEGQRASLPMENLLLDARVLLVQDGPNPNEAKLERAVDEFRKGHIQGDANATVTPERFQALSKALREIDPEFQAAWRKQVLKNYPWLDRILPREEQ